MALLSDALQNIAQGVTGFFGGKTKDATYKWSGYLQAFLTSQDQVLQGQYRWCLNPGYSFSVRGQQAWGAAAAVEGIPQDEDQNGMVSTGSGSGTFSE